MNLVEQRALQTEHYSRELETLEEMKSTFIRNVQHELRTPVAIILGYAELLQSKQFGTINSDQEQAMTTITRQARNLNTLIERITTMLSVQAKEMLCHPFSIAELIDDVIEQQRSKAEQNGLSLTAKIAVDIPLVLGDPEYLRQGLNCVVENALKFSIKNGNVVIEAERDEEWVAISVDDDGIGIAPAQLTQIFDTFYQADGSVTRGHGGLGLGLAVAKAVIEAHGGQIEVNSQLGRGSRFTLKLPVFHIPTEPDQAAALPQRIHRILIVDDEEYVVFTLKEGLQKLPNCEVYTASRGSEALEHFKRQPFDLLITDYKMPGMDGITLATQIRHMYPQTAIVVVTAYGDNLLHEQIIDAATIRCILDKPVKLSKIRQVTLEALAEANDSDPEHKATFI
ncbi:MAG: response regulator [Anaerolineae bacterium]|nr:response regulator [Anaerolineae bacterium]